MNARSDEVNKRTLYVGGLDSSVDESILQSAFIPFGDVEDVQVAKDQRSGRHRGFGFVTFELEEDAKAALDNMNLSEIFGRVLKVSFAKPSFGPARNKPIWEDEAYYQEQQRQQQSTNDSNVVISTQVEGEGFNSSRNPSNEQQQQQQQQEEEEEGKKRVFFAPVNLAAADAEGKKKV